MHRGGLFLWSMLVLRTVAGRVLPPAAVVREPVAALLQLVDPLRGFGLGEVLLERHVRLVGECLEVRALGTGHRLVARLPLVGILDGVGVALLVLLVLLVLRGLIERALVRLLRRHFTS